MWPVITTSTHAVMAVLLRFNMSVEVTLERAVRVVSHNPPFMALSIDAEGVSATVFHPALCVQQKHDITDAATDVAYVHMAKENFAFMIGGERLVSCAVIQAPSGRISQSVPEVSASNDIYV